MVSQPQKPSQLSPHRAAKVELPSRYGTIAALQAPAAGQNLGATALLRLVGGYVADRVRRRKAVAGTGYALSAVAKLGLLAAGASVSAIGAVIVVDRAGKGLRTAPRDAPITLSTPESHLGRAFGVHRAMDSMGAFVGPLVALAVLAASGQAFDAVFDRARKLAGPGRCGIQLGVLLNERQHVALIDV